MTCWSTIQTVLVCLLVPLTTCQTIQCIGRYICAGAAGETKSFYECKNDVLVTTLYNCSDINIDPTYVCYPERNTPTGNPCGPPPPASTCTAGAGSYPLPPGTGGVPIDYCRNYIVCPSSGSTPIIGTCPTGQEFSPINRTCLVTSSANCSSPLPPPPSTTVSPSTTTTPIPSTTLSTTTTASPSTTTLPPSTTTLPPSTTTLPPSSTTLPPGSTTLAPGSTTLAPGATTLAPGATTTTAPRCTPFRRRADNTSCRRYYRCFIFGFELNLRCPFGQRFSIPSNKCSFAGVDCGSRPA